MAQELGPQPFEPTPAPRILAPAPAGVLPPTQQPQLLLPLHGFTQIPGQGQAFQRVWPQGQEAIGQPLGQGMPLPAMGQQPPGGAPRQFQEFGGIRGASQRIRGSPVSRCRCDGL